MKLGFPSTPRQRKTPDIQKTRSSATSVCPGNDKATKLLCARALRATSSDCDTQGFLLVCKSSRRMPALVGRDRWGSKQVGDQPTLGRATHDDRLPSQGLRCRGKETPHEHPARSLETPAWRRESCNQRAMPVPPQPRHRRRDGLPHHLGRMPGATIGPQPDCRSYPKPVIESSRNSDPTGRRKDT